MICSEAKLKLEPCVSGRLSPEDRIALEEHLAICEGCRLELELTRAVMGAASSIEPPAGARVTEPATANPQSAAPDPPMSEARPQTALFDEISFENLESSTSSAEAAPATAPSAPLASAGTGGPDPFENFTKKPEPAESAAASWDFEPVEVPRDASPPEGSLSFAQEALTRKRAGEVKRKATLMRLALWGGGIGCGLVLLGVSVWIALAFRPAPAPIAPTTPTPTDTATPTPIQSAPGQNPPDGSAAPVPAPADGSQPPLPSTVTTPTETAPPTLLDATPGVVPSPGPPPPDTRVAADGSTRTGAAATKPASKSGVKPAPGSRTTKSGSAGDEDLFPWTPVDDPPVARTAATVRRSVPPSQPQPAPVKPPAPSPEPTILDATPGVAPANPPARTSAEQTTPAPPVAEPAPTKPIDRLHLATETAAKNADLATLRKIKSSWKSLIGSTAGPDRARAKREYADCLWSIQEITGRNSDRREALVAYRDYVLYAPAGGTDARTVSRMRFLEDILAN